MLPLKNIRDSVLNKPILSINFKKIRKFWKRRLKFYAEGKPNDRKQKDH
jgi:hypothetical protein